jgi:hypothetical protein
MSQLDLSHTMESLRGSFSVSHASSYSGYICIRSKYAAGSIHAMSIWGKEWILKYIASRFGTGVD